MAARSINDWFAEYGESHRNATNKLIHWICVPTIYFCVVGLLYSIPTPAFLSWPLTHVWAKLALILVVVFYLRTSWTIMLGMLLWSLFCLALCRSIDQHAAWPLWAVCAVLFAAAWIGQFYGHHIEGKKPSFLKDLQFLMIGPAWLMGFVYRRLGIGY
ncbi:MAG TPA: Mpo1-like protein [Flavobacteriales bacterium]|nr:Mpo1-like protein [Flavobacteriales bacterium]